MKSRAAKKIVEEFVVEMTDFSGICSFGEFFGVTGNAGMN